VAAGTALVSGTLAGARQWWLCPNEPRCPHAALFHDVYDDEDEVPRCCADGCQCGAAAQAADDRPDRQSPAVTTVSRDRP
jgi:hypothetical protein